MLQRWLLIRVFIILSIWNSYFSIILNVTETKAAIPLNFQVPVEGTYELIAGGACGGGTSYGDGGNGGLIAGLFKLTTSEIITVIIGEIGQTKSDKCGTAGGGGATSVYITRGQNTQKERLILVAPGGGGAGYYQTASPPDYKELILATDSGQCNLSEDPIYQAARGRSIDKYLNANSFTYNPTIPNENLTAGCLGGYGGGGQGGFMYQLNNYTFFSGGGGGGGGYVGGEISFGGKSSGCTAGGPGKPYCGADYCDIAKVNTKCFGTFLIKKHEPYKELPLKDRTNYEKPRVPQNLLQNGRIVSISILSLIFSTLVFTAHLFY